MMISNYQKSSLRGHNRNISNVNQLNQDTICSFHKAENTI